MPSIHKKITPPRQMVPQICNVILGICLLINIYSFFEKTKYTQVLGISLNLESAQILELVNHERKAQNLPTLEINDKLNQAALNKANDMLTNNYWDHYAPDNKTPWQFITESGYIYRYAGENLAKDYYDEQLAVRAWMQSPGHRANILNDQFTQTGIATVKGIINERDSILTVQLFATPFTPQELELLQNSGAVIVNQTSQIQPPITGPHISSSAFQSSRLAMAMVIILLTLVIALDIKHHSKKLKFHHMAKRYWLNLLLLVLTGTFYMITTIIPMI